MVGWFKRISINPNWGETGGFESVNTKVVCKLSLIKGGFMTERLVFQDEVYFKIAPAE